MAALWHTGAERSAGGFECRRRAVASRQADCPAAPTSPGRGKGPQARRAARGAAAARRRAARRRWRRGLRGLSDGSPRRRAARLAQVARRPRCTRPRRPAAAGCRT
eukprot:5261979-Prymnesium_polylepis.1